MSAVSHSPVWYPPEFPAQGRMPSRPEQVVWNIHRQGDMERDYHGALSEAAGMRVTPPCCKTLHISLFFDGTGNNLFNDVFVSAVPHPTNIARLFRATIGSGYAGGASGMEGLLDPPGTGLGQYYKYYMPGVGTPFPEVGDLDYSMTGLAFARHGEERINWGLLMIIDALRQELGLPSMDGAGLKASVEAMGSTLGIAARRSRTREFDRQLRLLVPLLGPAVLHPFAGKPKLVGIKLYVYGFSRGAAAARAFITWLNELLSHTERTQPALQVDDLRLPVRVQYLGLLDTVASVGIAEMIPGADGHMSWADKNQQLPGGNNLVKRCLHLVAGHEQRLCFPLDSIRRPSGGYPVNSQEVIYPGVHSDVGGGYPTGDQGKASGDNDYLLLSQIVLNDLFADAFHLGAPLKVPKDVLPDSFRDDQWRAMEPAVVRSLIVAPLLVERFNNWRNLTLLTLASPQSKESIEAYCPFASTNTLEQSLKTQLGWLTAWRIDRYAFFSMEHTSFYKQASDTHADPAVRNAAEATRDKKQQAVNAERVVQRELERRGQAPKPLPPGPKDFDPDLGKTQLREAANEFGEAFRDLNHLASRIDRVVPAAIGSPDVFENYHVDVGVECRQLKAAGRARVRELFPPPDGFNSHIDDHRRGKVDENRNASSPVGLLRALFDEHVHDSRAWFLYSWGREMFGSFFRERMVFFGDASRREIALNEQEMRELLAYQAPPAEISERWAEIQRVRTDKWLAERALTHGEVDHDAA